METSGDTARRVHGLIVPRGWGEGAMVLVMGGYIDGSNLHGGTTVVAVGGCAASVQAWPVWEGKWRELLAFCNVSKWDHSKFLGGFPPFPQRESAEWLMARRMLCEAFMAIKPLYIGASVVRTDYEDLRTRFSFLPEDPYYFLLDRCMYELIQGVFEHPRDEGIAIYCDQDRNERLVLQMARWHTAYLRGNDRARPGDQLRKISTTYGSNVDYRPLQAADVAAHELMRFARGHPDLPHVPTSHPVGHILDRLKEPENGLMMFWCLNKRFLEMELNGWAFDPDHWPGYRYLPPLDERG